MFLKLKIIKLKEVIYVVFDKVFWTACIHDLFLQSCGRPNSASKSNTTELSSYFSREVDTKETTQSWYKWRFILIFCNKSKLVQLKNQTNVK